MNLVVIEEHQVGDLVFAQLYYLYILLRPHWPMLSYQLLKYREPSTGAISKRIIKNPHGISADMGVRSLYQTRKVQSIMGYRLPWKWTYM